MCMVKYLHVVLQLSIDVAVTITDSSNKFWLVNWTWQIKLQERIKTLYYHDAEGQSFDSW